MQTSLEILEQSQHMLMTPYEIINTLYSTELKCSNPACANYVPYIPAQTETRKGSLDESDTNDNQSEKPSSIAFVKTSIKH